MADRYWVGDGGDWSDDDNHWATSSGGTPADGNAPTSSDDVYFDANSFTTSGQTVATDVEDAAASIDWTGATDSPTWGVNHNQVNIYGSLTLISGMSLTVNTGYAVAFKGSGSHTITSAGQDFAVVEFNCTGTYTLQDALNTVWGNGRRIDFHAGTIDADEYNVSGNVIRLIGSATRVINMGSGMWSTKGGYNYSYAWDFGTTTNVTLNCETSTLRNAKQTYGYGMKGGGLTYNDVEINGGSTSTSTAIHGSNTMATLTVAKKNLVKFEDGETQTVTSFVATGESGDEIYLQGTSTAGWTISDSTGTNTVSYCTIEDSTATGGATWDADDGTNTDDGDNSGWDFGATDATPTPSALTLSLTLPAPTVSITGSVTPTPSAQTLSLTLPAPTVIGDCNVSAAGGSENDSFTTSAGDGYVEAHDATWANILNAATGDTAFPTTTNAGPKAQFSGGDYWIYRGFYSFDTSALPDTTTITSASLFLYGDTILDDENDYLVIVEGSQASTSTLTTADYDAIGEVKGTAEIDATGFDDSGTNELPLNATGIGWINKTGWTKLATRCGLDIDEGTAPTGLNSFQFVTSESIFSNRWPYLYIEYTTELNLTLTVNAPTVSITGDVTPTPSAEALTLAVPAPSILSDCTVTPSALTLSLSVGSPTIDVSGNATPTPSALTLSLSIPAPSILSDCTVTPSAVALTLAIPAPTVDTSGNATPTPDAVALTLALPVPTVDVSGNATPAPAAVTLSLTLGSPTVDLASTLEYTYESAGSLPTSNDTNLSNAYSLANYLSVDADDADRVAATGGDFVIHQFKVKRTSASEFTAEWNGQSDKAASVSTIYLQVFNRDSTAWETLDSDNSAAADTDLDLSGGKSTSLSDYYDGNNWLSFRVYQEA